MASELPKDLSTLEYKFFKEGTICQVSLNRPKSLNAMNPRFFDEMTLVFRALNKLEDLRVVILNANGKHFTAGLDLKEANTIVNHSQDKDQARKSIATNALIKRWQESFSLLEDLRVPVIASIHGLCVGGGIDMITACDIRYCSKDAKFTIKEIDISICADLGTLQRLPLVMANDSLIRELAFTGRYFESDEASKYGLVSKVCDSKEDLDKNVMKLAENIADKSPVVVYAIKKVLNSARKSKVTEGLEYVALMNQSIIFTDDVLEAMRASMSKETARFSKL